MSEATTEAAVEVGKAVAEAETAAEEATEAAAEATEAAETTERDIYALVDALIERCDLLEARLLVLEGEDAEEEDKEEPREEVKEEPREEPKPRKRFVRL